MKKKRTPDKIKFSLILLIIFLFAVSPADVLQMGDLLIEHDQRDAKIALQLGNNLQENISKFQKSIGQYPKLKTQLVIATSEDDYRNRFRSRKEIMEFSQAFYSPSRKTIFIRNPRDKIKYNRLNRIVFHEYLHHFVFHYFYNAPLWFHEGMAVYFSGDFSQQREINLAIQYFLRNTLSLKEMINYPDK